MEPTVVNYTALTTTVLRNDIVLEFSDSFQYGRLWEGLLLGINCGGIPISERFDLSMIIIIAIEYCGLYYSCMYYI